MGHCIDDALSISVTDTVDRLYARMLHFLSDNRKCYLTCIYDERRLDHQNEVGFLEEITVCVDCIVVVELREADNAYFTLRLIAGKQFNAPQRTHMAVLAESI